VTSTASQSLVEPNRRYAGKIAVVTGGAVGLGASIARAMASEGATVALLDVDGPSLDVAATSFGDAGHTALGLLCDVSDEVAVDAAIERIAAEFGGIDILVNNAAKHLSKYNQPFSRLARSDVRALFDVNVIGPVNCSVACRAPMAKRPNGGVILNIASVAGHSVSTPYGVSKLAVRGLTTAFAKEFASDRIRVNAVSPSALADLSPELLKDYADNRQLIHRQGRVADVVSAALFLCSDEASFITGETLKVSAGFPLET
jgi:3-oxoacyl-[acyl-carrier protein] reductase